MFLVCMEVVVIAREVVVAGTKLWCDSQAQAERLRQRFGQRHTQGLCQGLAK